MSKKQVEKIEHKLGFINPKDCDLLDYVVEGKKTIEGRKVNEKIKAMKKGDLLVIKTKAKNVECKIEGITMYKSFDEFLKKEKVKDYMPCVKTAEEAKTIYESFNKGNPIEGEYAAIKIKFLRQVFYRGVKEPWFSYIKENKKKVEGRLGRGSFLKMRKGDKIVWVNNKELAPTEVKDVKKYKTFKDLIDKEKLEDLLPGVKDKKEAMEVYRSYFPEEVEKQVGEVVAIHLKKLDE